MENITHHVDRCRFEIVIDGNTAYIEYDNFDSGIAITHTVVPKPIGGQGVAAALMKHVLEYAQENNLNVKPICSYAVTYMQRQGLSSKE